MYKLKVGIKGIIRMSNLEKGFDIIAGYVERDTKYIKQHGSKNKSRGA